MYSYMKDDDKGIKKNVIKKTIKHDNYKERLFNYKQILHTMKLIRSQNFTKL